jgi:hypothetical protein
MISSPEAPAIRLAVASKAACIFSLTISLASRRALPPPSISFIIRNAITAICLRLNPLTQMSVFLFCFFRARIDNTELSHALSAAASHAKPR